MVTIIFESHSTSLDNENQIASGHFDVDLSDLGKGQAQELGERYKDVFFDGIFCSDLKRTYQTAEIAFGNRGFPIIKDPRLRECDYGDFTRLPSGQVEIEKVTHISQPFPNGESYEQVMSRMQSFFKDLLSKYDNKKVLIIGHRAIYYALEHFVKKTPLKEVIELIWRWQPGWEYQLRQI